MTIADRDRRALMALGAAIVVTGVVYFWPSPKVELVGGAPSSVEQAAARLQRVRQEAAQLSVREDWRKRGEAELAQLEKGLIQGETVAQVEAQLLQTVRRVSRAQLPPLELRGADFGAVRPFGDQYAEALLNVALECQIEQLVNFLADLGAQPELLAVDDLRIAATTSKQKAISVRVVVSGLARGSLLKTSVGARR